MGVMLCDPLKVTFLRGYAPPCAYDSLVERRSTPAVDARHPRPLANLEPATAQGAMWAYVRVAMKVYAETWRALAPTKCEAGSFAGSICSGESTSMYRVYSLEGDAFVWPS